MGPLESLDPQVLQGHEAHQAQGEPRDSGVPEDRMDQLGSRDPRARRALQDHRANLASPDSRGQLESEATLAHKAFPASLVPQAHLAPRASLENRALRDPRGQ